MHTGRGGGGIRSEKFNHKNAIKPGKGAPPNFSQPLYTFPHKFGQNLMDPHPEFSNHVIAIDSTYSVQGVDFVDGVVSEELRVLLDVLHHLLSLVDEHSPRPGHVTTV